MNYIINIYFSQGKFSPIDSISHLKNLKKYLFYCTIKNMKDENLHKNHRKRLRATALKAGLNNLPEHQLLEYVLSFAMPRIDVNPLAHKLINKFGSFSKVLNASIPELKSVEGIGDILAQYIASFKPIFEIYQRTENEPKAKLSSPFETSRYFISKLGELDHEEVLLASIDSKSKVISLDKIGKGNDISATVSTQEIYKLLGRNHCTNFVLAHNHPNATAVPSLQDDLFTKNLYVGAKLAGFRLCDHVIVSGDEYYSYMEHGVLDEYDKDLQTLKSPNPTSGGLWYGI